MNPEEFASRIVDVSAASDIVDDYDLTIHENIVVRARITLTAGFIDIYRNFDTGKTAFAWIVDEERVFGADNTGGWHVHPYEDSGNHRESGEWTFQEFIREVEDRADEGTKNGHS